MLRVPPVANRFKEIVVTTDAPDILGRTSPGTLDANWRADTSFPVDALLDEDFVLPAVHDLYPVPFGWKAHAPAPHHKLACDQALLHHRVPNAAILEPAFLHVVIGTLLRKLLVGRRVADIVGSPSTSITVPEGAAFLPKPQFGTADVMAHEFFS